MHTPRDLPSAIRAEVARSGMTAAHIQARTGMSRGRWARRMSCPTSWQLGELIALARALRIPASTLTDIDPGLADTGPEPAAITVAMALDIADDPARHTHTGTEIAARVLADDVRTQRDALSQIHTLVGDLRGAVARGDATGEHRAVEALRNWRAPQ